MGQLRLTLICAECLRRIHRRLLAPRSGPQQPLSSLHNHFASAHRELLERSPSVHHSNYLGAIRANIY
jgi:hypothetical protein